MTAKIGSAATAKVVKQPTGGTGMNASLGALTAGAAGVAAIEAAQVSAQNVAADLAERSSTIKYPAVQVYCDKIVNNLKEKFRSFSGNVQMTIELRHSQDRLEGLQDSLELYTDAAAQTLNASRGDWGDGMFYSGGYEVSFGSVKQGGKKFIQVAKVTFEIGVSRS